MRRMFHNTRFQHGDIVSLTKDQGGGLKDKEPGGGLKDKEPGAIVLTCSLWTIYMDALFTSEIS